MLDANTTRRWLMSGNEYNPWVVTHEDGSQTLLSIFVEDGEITAVQYATRSDRWGSWGVPEDAVKG